MKTEHIGPTASIAAAVLLRLPASREVTEKDIETAFTIARRGLLAGIQAVDDQSPPTAMHQAQVIDV